MKKISIFALSVLLGACSSGLQEKLDQSTVTIQQLQNQVVDLRAENAGLQQQLSEAKQARIPTGVIAVDASGTGSLYQRVSAGTVVSEAHGVSYDNALQLYRAGDIDGAIRSFEAFLAGGAQGEQAALAQYWIGDANYSKQDYPQAVRYLGTFLRNMPHSEKSVPALEKLIRALRAVGRNEDADVLQSQGVSAIQ